MTHGQDFHPPVSPLVAALRGRCPRCGEGRLFAGLLAVVPRCATCDLDLRGHDSGDGPAVFVIMLLGAVMMVLVFWLEFTYEPPWWLHIGLWLPLLMASSIGLLRVLKGLLVALQFRHRSTAIEE